MPRTTTPPSKSSTERWDNEGGRLQSQTTALDDQTIEMTRYGIVPVHLIVFDWGGYRYSNLNDAIAAAKRFTKSA